MIDEIMWDSRAERVTLTISGSARVVSTDIRAVDFDEESVVVMPYAEAMELGATLLRGFGIAPTDGELDELENLRMTTAEDKRVIDRQAAEISTLRLEHAKAMGDASYWRHTAITEAAEADGADALRATIVRQANEITALKETSA